MGKSKPRPQNGLDIHSHPISRCQGPLPLLESLFYWLTGIGSILYVLYEVHQASKRNADILNKEDFIDGWGILDFKKDISDFEWNFWSGYFWQILPWILGHIILAQVVNNFFIQVRKEAFLFYSVLSVTRLLGYQTVVFFTLHACICYLVSSLGSFRLVWVASLTLLATLNFDVFDSWMKTICAIPNDSEERGFYLFIFVLAIVILKYTSFCLDRSQYISSQTSGVGLPVEDESYSLLDLLLYVFYLPLFFTGPLLIYSDFKKQMSILPPAWNSNRFLSSISNFLRIFFWAVFLEVFHHLIYHNALQRSASVLETVSLWCLLGSGYIKGQTFMVKYVVMYGLPAQVAKLDGLDPPKEPKCISYIYRYSDMWKYFDRGLNAFLKTYIYIPLGGSRAGLLRQMIATLASFLYVYMWHGQEYYLLLWALANCLGCSLEALGSRLDRSQFLINIKENYLSPAMVRRINCAVYTPLFLMSVYAIFYFFAGISVGDIFIRRLVTHASMKARLIIYCVIYVNIQNAMSIERWMAFKKKMT